MYFLFGPVTNESKEPDDSRSSHMCSYRARQITMGLLFTRCGSKDGNWIGWSRTSHRFGWYFRGVGLV